MILDLDANATYAPNEQLQALISAALARLGNPSSLHRGGQRAKAAIEGAREVVRSLVGASSQDTVVFTSGATEANNLIVYQLASRQKTARAVSSTIEHPCILAPLRALEQSGCEVVRVSPTARGEISPASVSKTTTPDTRLVSVMWANNETGVVNDIPSIAAAVRAISPQALVHSDCAQMVGKLAIDFRSSGLDALTISGHKFGSLTGVGALVIREGVSLSPQILGGPQEQRLRGGTENVIGIVSLAAAGMEVIQTLPGRTASMARVRDRFEVDLLSAIPDCMVNGSGGIRLPNTSSVTIPGVRGDDMVVALDLHDVQISSGAACSSGKPEPSHVLLAMGNTEEQARSTIRVSFRADQSTEIASAVLDLILATTSRMRAAA